MKISWSLKLQPSYKKFDIPKACLHLIADRVGTAEKKERFIYKQFTEMIDPVVNILKRISLSSSYIA